MTKIFEYLNIRIYSSHSASYTAYGEEEEDEMGLGGSTPLYSSAARCLVFGCSSQIFLSKRLSEYNIFDIKYTMQKVETGA